MKSLPRLVGKDSLSDPISFWMGDERYGIRLPIWIEEWMTELLPEYYDALRHSDLDVEHCKSTSAFLRNAFLKLKAVHGKPPTVDLLRIFVEAELYRMAAYKQDCLSRQHVKQTDDKIEEVICRAIEQRQTTHIPTLSAETKLCPTVIEKWLKRIKIEHVAPGSELLH